MYEARVINIANDANQIMLFKRNVEIKNLSYLFTAKATKTHFYWAMRNNDGTAAGFQQYLLNIVDHYQVKNEELSPVHQAFDFHGFIFSSVLQLNLAK